MRRNPRLLIAVAILSIALVAEAEKDVTPLNIKNIFLKALKEENPVSFDKRIIGGSEIKTGDWPWLVSLRAKIGSINVNCGGSLINDYWVLSAAHCFNNPRLNGKDKQARYWEARLGDKDQEASLWETFKGFLGNFFSKDEWVDYEIDVSQIILHPQYKGRENLWLNDIALLKLKEAVPSSASSVARIQAVILPDASLQDSDWPPDESDCVMKGWGCTSAGGKVEEIAKEVDLPKVSDKKCSWLWGIQAVFRLCAGHDYANKGICSGDSGGPLVCKAGDRWIQAGIASFTSSQYPEDFPGAFTRVTHYVDWISETIKNK